MTQLTQTRQVHTVLDVAAQTFICHGGLQGFCFSTLMTETAGIEKVGVGSRREINVKIALRLGDLVEVEGCGLFGRL